MLRNIILRVFVCFVLLWLLLSSFSVSGVSITANALSGGVYMPSEVARAYFGDEISATYYTASGNQNATFRYYGTDTFPLLFGYDSSVSGYDQDIADYITNATFIIYSAELTGILNDPTQIVLDIQPTYSIFDTTEIISCLGASGTYYNPEAYISASWDWYFSGQTLHFESPINTFGYGMRSKSNYLETEFNLVPVHMTSQSTTSGYSLRGVFPVANSTCYIALGCPYVSAGSSGGSGVPSITTTQETQQAGASEVVSGIAETNDILEEHSGLLADIIDFLHYIGECIAGDESEVSEVEPIETMENPPDWDDAMSQVESALDDIPDITASGGFIWALYNLIMSTSPVIKFLVPFGLIITLLSYIWWKK